MQKVGLFQKNGEGKLVKNEDFKPNTSSLVTYTQARLEAENKQNKKTKKTWAH